MSKIGSNTDKIKGSCLDGATIFGISAEKVGRQVIAKTGKITLPVNHHETYSDGMKLNEGLIFSILSMLTLGVSNYLYKRSVEFLGPTNTTFFYYIFSTGLAVVAWLFFREKERITAASLVWPALLAVFLFISVWTFNYAVQTIDVSVASTIRSLCFVITIFLAIVLSEEKLSIKDWVAVTFAVLSIVLFGIKTENFK